MAEYLRYYHEDRTHLGLAKDTPAGRPIAIPPPSGSTIRSFPRPASSLRSGSVDEWSSFTASFTVCDRIRGFPSCLSGWEHLRFWPPAKSPSRKFEDLEQRAMAPSCAGFDELQDEQNQPTVDQEEMEMILGEAEEPYCTLYALLAGCGPMRAGEALGLDIRSIHEDFRTLEIVQKAKRGNLQDHMKTKNADSRHGRVVDLSEPLAAMLRDFVSDRTSGLVFCKPDGSQLMQRDILKHSLHPILKKLGLEQGGLNIFRRFRITKLETAEVPAALQHTWSGHAKSHVSEVYKKLLKQREWRLRRADKTGTGFTLPGHQQAAAEASNGKPGKLLQFRKVG